MNNICFWLQIFFKKQSCFEAISSSPTSFTARGLSLQSLRPLSLVKSFAIFSPTQLSHRAVVFARCQWSLFLHPQFTINGNHYYISLEQYQLASWSVWRINRGGGPQMLKKQPCRTSTKLKSKKQVYKFQLSLPWSLKQIFLSDRNDAKKARLTGQLNPFGSSRLCY